MRTRAGTRQPLLLVMLALARLTPAVAHGAEDAGGWTFDAWIVVPLAISLWLYFHGMQRLWRRSRAGHVRHFRNALAYGAGWLTLGLALLSPFHGWGERLFTYHMVEHEIIMAVAAPLLVVARPVGVMLWSLPRRLRLGLARATQNAWLQYGWTWLTRPTHATIIHGAAIWLWHWPALFDAAVTGISLHRWQHTSFFVTALLFWYALLRTSGSGEAVWHLFFTMVHTSVLGALIAVAPRVMYTTQTAHSFTWGLTPLEDQQLAGLFMWVPAGTVYAGAALLFAVRWIRGSPKRTSPTLVRSGVRPLRILAPAPNPDGRGQ